MFAREVKKKKAIFWGIEVPETLSWHGWELGKEMIKHLTLKNVHGKAQKLSYRCVGSLFVFVLLMLSLCLHSLLLLLSLTSAPFLKFTFPLSP